MKPLFPCSDPHEASVSCITGAAYIRVSTNEQLELSPESQLKEIFSYAASHNISIPPANIFMEKEGRSGKRAENRPEFQRMIATAKSIPKPFDVILVWKFSRFARNQDESTFYKGMLRKKLGIDIISVSEPVMEGMYGRLIELIIEWQDEFYSYNLSTEVRRGMTENARKGGYQAAIPYGYQYNGPGTVPSVIEEQAIAIRTIFSLFVLENQNPSKIARVLNSSGFRTKRGNLFDRRAVLYIIRNPFYIGKIRWNPAPKEASQEEAILAEGRHEPIISEELYQKAQSKLTQPSAIKYDIRKNSTSQKHFLSGLLKCSCCGANLAFHPCQSSHFQCWRYSKGLHEGSCSISEKRAISALLTSLESVLQSEKKQTISALHQKKLELLSLRRKRIQLAYEKGIDSLQEYEERLRQLNDEYKELLTLSEKEKKRTPPSFETVRDQLLNSDVDDKIKSGILRSILKEIVFDRKTNSIKFYYFI